MRLAYVLERYPELTQTFVEAELRELKRLGDEVEVLALQRGDGAELADASLAVTYPAHGGARLRAAAGVAVRGPGPVSAFLRRRGAGERWPPNTSRVRGLARIAGWQAAAAGGEHLHAHFASEAADIAELLGALTHRRHSFTGHSTDLFADPDALRARLEAAAFAVLVCEYDRREVERAAPGAGTLHVIPLGIDLEAIRRTKPYDPEGPIVSVGRLVEHKGFADLAAIAPSLGREVVIAGEGPQRSELESLARGAATFPGALNPAAARDLIERASVLVAPSVIASDGSRDGIPMVLKEALALETPIVASDAVGNPEVTHPDHGASYPAGARDGLAAAIGAILARPDREAMGKAGRAFAERDADLRKQTARLRDLFKGAAC